MMEYFDLEAILRIDLQIEHIFTYTKKSIFATQHNITGELSLGSYYGIISPFLPKYFLFIPFIIQYDIL